MAVCQNQSQIQSNNSECGFRAQGVNRQLQRRADELAGQAAAAQGEARAAGDLAAVLQQVPGDARAVAAAAAAHERAAQEARNAAVLAMLRKKVKAKQL